MTEQSAHTALLMAHPKLASHGRRGTWLPDMNVWARRVAIPQRPCETLQFGLDKLVHIPSGQKRPPPHRHRDGRGRAESVSPGQRHGKD